MDDSYVAGIYAGVGIAALVAALFMITFERECEAENNVEDCDLVWEAK